MSGSASTSMCQRDMRDPWWVPAPLKGHHCPSQSSCSRPHSRRYGYRRRCDRADFTAADHLASAGYAVTEIDVPDLTDTWQLWCNLIMTEVSVFQIDQMREHGSADYAR